ncbi:zinc finger protein ZAT3 [Tanacetum coccineum]
MKKEKPFICKQCGKKFHNLKAVTGHKRIHSLKYKTNRGVKGEFYTSFDDTEQDKAAAIAALTLMMLRGDSCEFGSGQSSQDLGKNKSRKSFKCAVCFKEFGSGSALGGHMRAHYYKCSVCLEILHDVVVSTLKGLLWTSSPKSLEAWIYLPSCGKLLCKMDLMEDMLLLKFVADPGRRNHRCYCPRAQAQVCRQHRLSDVCIMPNACDVDHHDTASYIPLYHRTGGFTGNERDIYKSLVYRLFHEGRVVLPDFLEDKPNLCPTFRAIGFDSLLDIDEQICPVFVLQFYRSFRLIRNLNGAICVRFTIDNVETILTLENFTQILRIPCEAVCLYSHE